MIAEQRLARAAHRLGVLALLGVELGVEQQPGHADHAVHRRADLVAHVGQELRLQARGLERLVARDGQLLLGSLSLGDVAQEGVERVPVPVRMGEIVSSTGNPRPSRCNRRQLEPPAEDRAVAGGQEPLQPLPVRSR